jgi:hypothetical protein
MGPDIPGEGWKKNQEFPFSAPLRGGLFHRSPEENNETLLRSKLS